MDITPEYASQLAQSRLSSQVGIAVAKKVLDQQRADGHAAIELLEAAAKVAVSSTRDADATDLYA
jgi:Putative motility protein